jgi:hypothetical protein
MITNNVRALVLTSLLVAGSAFGHCLTQTFTLSTLTAQTTAKLVTADFNGDGRPDAAAVTSNQGVVVWYGQNGGALGGAVAFGGTKTNLIDLIVLDLNGDGHPDLISLDSLGTTLGIYRNNGSGSFTVTEIAAPLPPGLSLQKLAAGRFNNDANDDFVAVTAGTSGVAPLFLSNGDGTFSSTGGLTLQAKASTLLATADLNADGYTDILSGYGGTGLIDVQLADGNGSFAASGVLPSGMSPAGIAFADFNGDGRTDYATADSTAGTFSVNIANGGGGYASPVSYYSGQFVNASSKPVALAASDFDNDGHLDMIVANNGEGTITLFRGNADGTFNTTPTVFKLANQYAAKPASLAVADFDNDGRADVLTADTTSSNATLLTNGCGVSNVSFTLDHPTISNGQSARVDIVVAAPQPGTGPTPTGSARVRDAAGVLATVTLDNGHAVATIAPSTGDHALVVEYLGDSNYDAHNSASTTLHVVTATTSVNVSVVPNPVTNGQSATLSVTVSSSTGDTPTGYVLRTIDGNQAANADALPFTPQSVGNLGVGSHTIVVDYLGDATHPPSTSAPYTFTIQQPGASMALTAAWDGSKVVVHFTPNGAASYRVMRASGSANNFTQAGTTTSGTFNDTTASSNIAYLYRVDGYDGSNAFVTSSNTDLATTVTFTDATITAGVTTIKAAHLTELRTAINLVRALAGLGATSFTEATPAAGGFVRATHVTDLRPAIAAARSALSLPGIVFTDASLSPGTSVVRAIHINELRAAVQ